jgi:hypothetical protein
MSEDLPRAVRVLARCIPARDREWILGDLIEAAFHRRLTGMPRGLWLFGSCGAIVVALSVTRTRAWLVLPPVHEVATGVAIDGRFAVRGAGKTTLLSGLFLGGSIGMLTVGVAILVATLLSASGLDHVRW